MGIIVLKGGGFLGGGPGGGRRFGLDADMDADMDADIMTPTLLVADAALWDRGSCGWVASFLPLRVWTVAFRFNPYNL